MSPFDLPICPCCTGAMLHTLAQNAGWLTSQSLLQLGKGALIATIGPGETTQTPEPALNSGSPTLAPSLAPSLAPLSSDRGPVWCIDAPSRQAP
jgi:hypothetical protein